MQDLSKKRLAVFFTRNVSFKKWHEIGNLDREISLYVKLKEYFSDISFFTYGGVDDEKYLGQYSQLFKVFPNRWKIPGTLYSVLLPFLHRSQLKNIDIYKTNQMDGAWAAVVAKWLYGKKLIVRCGYEWYVFVYKQGRSWLYQNFVKLMEKIVYKFADKIIITTGEDEKFILGSFGVSDKKILVLPNFIDTEVFRPLEIDKVSNKIIFIGRLNPQKNLHNLIKAVDGLEVELSIFGEGQLEEELLNLSKNIKTAKIKFCGNIPNNQLPAELNSSTLFVLPSLFEGNPKTLLEAMGCGTAVVATDVPGIKDVVRHKENGYLCDISVESIRSAIVEVLGNSELRLKMSVNARNTIVGGYSLEKVVEKEVGIYNDI